MGAILFKEWLKVKNIYFLFLAVMCVNLIQIYNSITSTIEYKSAISFVGKVVHYKSFDFNGIFYTNILIALVIGLFQFYKERDNARIRLHMHLPYSYLTNINSMIFSGLFLVFITFLFQFFVFYFLVQTYLPQEVIYPLVLKLICSFFNGFIVYLAAPSVLIEPNKIKNLSSILITSLFVLVSFWINISYYTSEKILFVYLIAILFQFANLYLSFYRYTKGYIK